jgi:hypothetical protein
MIIATHTKTQHYSYIVTIEKGAAMAKKSR